MTTVVRPYARHLNGAGPALVGALLAGTLGVVLAAYVAREGAVLDQEWTLLVPLALWWVAFAAGAAWLLQRRPRYGMAVVVLVAVALRLAALAGAPVLSDDLYRYAWDAQVQASGVDPYRFAPTAPELASLRGDWLWPDETGCAELDRPPGCTRINRAGEPTIYPPLAQAAFRAGAALLPEGAEDRGWQALAMGVDLGLIGILALVLRSGGHDPTSVVLYAWSPIAVLESAQSGHIDALAIAAAVGAVWASRRRRPVLAGVLLGIATLTKLYPVLLAPVVVRARPLRTGAALGATVVLGYAPHVADVGWKVLGYLPGYLGEEGYAEGSRFLLVGLTGATGVLAQGMVAAGLGVTAMWAWRSRRRPEVVATTLVGVALLLATPVQPWYALLLVALAALAQQWWWLVVAAAGYPLYLATLVDGPAVAVGRLGYGVAAVIVVAAIAARWRPGAGPLDDERPLAAARGLR